MHILSKAYFHGGVPGLPTGTVLLSRNRAAQQGLTGYWEPRPGNHLADYVYFTTDLDLAKSYAHSLLMDASGSRGSVYEVQPNGPVEADPDYPGVTDVFMAESATVTSVVIQTLQLTPEEETRPFAIRQFWVNGPYVDAQGFVQPDPHMEQAGWNTDVLKLLGPWVAKEELPTKLSELALTRPEAIMLLSPGIGQVSRGRRHYDLGLTEEAINSLCIAHYGSEATFRSAQSEALRQHYDSQRPKQDWSGNARAEEAAPLGNSGRWKRIRDRFGRKRHPDS
jgi:hypothetical protein